MLCLRGRLSAILTCLTVLLSVQAVRSAEIDRYLPEDTEVISTLNFKQLLDSQLMKKYALTPLKDLLNGTDEVKTVLQDLGFDPFKDLDRVLTAGPGGSDTDKGLVIIHGRFDLAKFNAKGDEVSKSNSDILKVHKIPDGKGGQFILYEVTPGELPNALFVALASEKTMLVSPGKDYVVDAMKRKDKPVLKNKDFQALLEKMNPRQSFAFAALGSALAKADVPDQVKNSLQNLEAIGGGITIGEDINLEFVGNAKTVQAAKDINQAINDGLTQGLAFLSLLATQQKQLAPAVDIVKTMKSTAREKTITIKATIPAEVIEKWTKGD
jgi:hypothetical protein